MIIADIVKELGEQQNFNDLLAGVKAVRTVYSTLPRQLKQEMLSEFSNLEYCFMSAIREKNTSLQPAEQKIIDSNTIHDTYVATK